MTAEKPAALLGTIGDLVEDIVVRLAGPINAASDTEARIVRRRGGSAANMAVSVVRAGGRARFIGQVGDDAVGEQLVRGLADEGVDVVARRAGRTGAIVVLLDADGERTFLTDRAVCALLDDPDATWLDGLSVLHVPVYSLVGEPLATTAATLIGWAHDRGVIVSVDASSSAVLDGYGAERMRALLSGLRPDVLLCNELEAATLGGVDAVATIGAGITVVKHGGGDALLLATPAETWASIPAEHVDAVLDTTGAGDAFAAGFLVALAGGATAVDAVCAGHAIAAELIRSLALSAGGAERRPL